MTDNVKEPFNTATDRRKPSIHQEPKPRPTIRDQDNAAPSLKPGFSRISRRNLAPRGMKGIQVQNKNMAPEQNEKQDGPLLSDDFEMTRGDLQKDGWVHGFVATHDGYSFRAKLTAFPSERGIACGRIEKLHLKHNDYPAAFYDRVWHLPPETQRDKEVINKIHHAVDQPERRFPQIAPPDKDRGHER